MVDSERLERRVRGLVIRVAAVVAAVALSALCHAQGGRCTRLRPAFAVPAHATEARVEVARGMVLESGGPPEAVFAGRLQTGDKEYVVRALTFGPGGAIGERTLLLVPQGGPRQWLFDLFAGDFDGDGWIDLLVAWGSAQSGQPPRLYELYRGAPSGEYLPAEGLATHDISPWRLAGDVDGDGRTELIAGTGSGSNVYDYEAGSGWSLANSSTFHTEWTPAIGDFDGDGVEDLAMAFYDQPERILVAWGAASSPLASVATLAVPGLTRPTSPRAAQLDGVGRMELLVRGRTAALEDQLRGVSFLSRDQAVLLWSQTFESRMPYDWQVLDVDDDHRDDAVFGPQLNDFDPPGFIIYHNDGDGPFRPGQVGTMPPSVVALRDIDGDGLLDAVLIRDSTFLWYRGSGGGVFDEGLVYAPAAAHTLPRIADFDEDGILDIATIAAKEEEWGVQIGLGNGDGTFRDGTWVPRDFRAAEAVTDDIDGDGHADLLLAPGGGSLRIAYGRGDGSFEAWRSYGAPEEGVRIALGDLDGDGQDDLVLLGNAQYDRSTRRYTSRITPILVRGRDWTPAASFTVAGGQTGRRIPRLALGDIAEGGGEELVYVRWEEGPSPTVAWRSFGAEEGRFGREKTVAHWEGSQEVYELAVRDFDRDGRDDLFVRGGEGGARTVRVYKGDGRGGLQLIQRQPSFAATYAGGQVADVDGDGEWDLGGGRVHTLLWARGNGTGGFEVEGSAWYGPAGDAIFVDLDNDGRPDRFGVPFNYGRTPAWLVFNRNIGSYAASDLEPPALDLRLLPAVNDEQTPAFFDEGWRVQVVTDDDCDAWPLTRLRRLDAPSLEPETPVFYRPAERREIRVWKDPGGTAEEVMLTGPEEGAMRDLWAEVLAHGGFDLEPDQIVRMPLAETYGAEPAAWEDDAFIPHSHRLVRRYVLEGRRLVTAGVSEPGADLIVRVVVADRAGHEASAGASLLEQKRRYCEDAQAADVVCR